jgi:hypothetical protein
MWAVLVTSLALAAPGEMVARTLDGKEIAGTLVELAGPRVVLQTPAGPVAIAPEQILNLKPKSPPKPGGDVFPRVEFVDGSRLAVGDYAVSKGQARLTLREQSAEAPVKIVSTVRFKPENVATKAQWEDIYKRAEERKFRGDVIVIRRAENAVDPLEGLFHDVLTDKEGTKVVQFALEEDVRTVPLERVDGMVYFHAAPQRFSDPTCIATDADGSMLRLKNIQFASGKLELETLAGLKVTRTPEQMVNLDFSGGKLMYLAVSSDDVASDELAPLRVVGPRPCFTSAKLTPELQNAAKQRAKLNLRKNSWGVDKPLTLRGKAYSRGIAAWSGTELEYPLRRQYRRFTAVVGIDDWPKNGLVRLIIKGDDKTLLDATLAANDPPKELDFDVSQFARLSIIVDYGQEPGRLPSDIGDALDLCEAKVTK